MATNAGSAQDLVTIEDIRSSTVILKNGGLRQVIMVGGVNFSLKSNVEQNVLTEAYQNFLNSLNFQLQIIIHSRKINIDRYLANLAERGEQEIAPLLKNQIKEYQEFIRSFVEQNAIMAKTFFVIVPFSSVTLPGKSNLMNFLPFGKGRDAKKQQEEAGQEFEKNVAQLSQRSAQVTDGLRAIGLEAIVLEDEALIELFYNFYNPGNVEKRDIIAKK